VRSALVTGVCGGIGGAIAQCLLHEGWTVYGIDIEDASTAPDGVIFDRIDVSIASDRESAFGGLGGLRNLSALVNVAAIQLPQRFDQTDEDVWERTLKTNLIGAAELIRLMLPALRNNRGTVVNIASVHARATSSGLASYAASKAGLVGLTRALAVELARDGVRVNAVLPGAVETQMLHDGFTRADDPGRARAELLMRTPLGRIAEPSNIADLVSFLLDERSSFVTGQEFVVDGGVLSLLSSEGAY
jgi:NAD(P)-dependent dehydrogenase (short-subunit alcohol dehydrogenase family)